MYRGLPLADTLFSMTISINVQHPLHKKAKFIHPVNCRSLIYKQNGNSQLLLDTLRVLGIILQHTLYLGLFTWREGAPANQATLGGLTSHMFF